MKFFLLGFLAIFQVNFSVSFDEVVFVDNEVYLKSDYAQEKANDELRRADTYWSSWKV